MSLDTAMLLLFGTLAVLGILLKILDMVEDVQDWKS